jgi:predicted RND superfamily exporter protein
MFADFRGFSEFGFIAGLGIMLALVCMLFVLPALLVIFDRWKWILLVKRSEDFEFRKTTNRFPYSTAVVSASILITVVVLAFVGNMRFEYQFSKLEPVFEEYEEFKDFTAGVDENSRSNPAYIIADNDAEVFELLEILREKKESNPESMIADVEALQERFPPTEEMANQKLEYLAEIRQLLQNSFLVGQDNETLDILRRGSQTTEPLDESRIPDFLKNRFTNRDGEIGKFVIIYPDRGLSDGRNSIAFKNEISDIELENGKTYFAASTSIVAASMLELMRDESPYMVVGTLIVVFLFILFSFGNIRWSLIALIPLLIGLTWLFGIMLIFDLKFNFYNLVVLPAILGIGCDNGIHLAHRFRDEGKKNMAEVLRSTGQHITIGSLTTMMGFAGLLFTSHPGLQSIGIMAVIGIGMTLFTALTVLPSLVQFMEDRHWLHD